MATVTSGRARDEERRKVKITNRSVCHLCKKDGIKADEMFCPNCGFPQGGTETEQRKFLVDRRAKRSDIRDSERLIRRGRNCLLVIAGINLLNFAGAGTVLLAVGGVVSALFLGIAFWAMKNPFPAFLTGFIVYVSLHLFLGILSFDFLIHGLFLKIAIAGTLVYGMYAIKKIEKLKDELTL